MLIMSAAVTMLTQFFGTWLFNLKGVALRKVVARLLTTLDRGVSAADASAIADHILRDPLVGQPPLFGNKQSLAEVVHREELVKLILDFACGGELEKASQDIQSGGSADGSNNKKSSKAAEKLRLQNVLLTSLNKNGIKDPEAILAAVRGAILELEKSSAELSNSARAAVAILNFAASDFLAKINSWFDQSIDRAVDIFTVRIRIVTFLVSVCIALLFQLNTFELINRLSVDKELRDSVVTAAIARANAGPPAGLTPVSAPQNGKAIAAPGPASGSTTALVVSPSNSLAKPQQSLGDVIKGSGADQLEQLGLIAFPNSVDEWVDRWDKGWLPQLFGIILSAALLSLGAPFWYSMLANLVKLRSVVAGKDDVQRDERQTGQEPTSSNDSLPPNYRGGEAGDLTATA